MNRSVFYERTTCRVCLSPGPDLAVKLEATPFGDRYVPSERLAEVSERVPLDLTMCRVCGNLQTLAVPNPDLIYRHFLSRPAAINRALFDAFEEYAGSAVQRFDLRGRFAVEFGSNDGIFARMLADRGMSVLGVDPALNLAGEARQLGIETCADYFTTSLAAKIRDARGEAGLMVANYVLANIDDLEDVMGGVRCLLARDGVFAVETSNTGAVVDRRLIEVINHDHITYFYARTLATLCARHALRLFDVEHVPAKGGALRCFIGHEDGPHATTERLRQALASEDARRLTSPATYAPLQEFLRRQRDQLQALIASRDGSSVRVAAYGTSLAGTILSYQYGLGGVLEFFVDDDPNRQNLVSPGFGVPVLPPSTLLERMPDYTIITAPQYAEQIVQRNEGYLAAGGRFVLVWPEFEVISGVPASAGA